MPSARRGRGIGGPAPSETPMTDLRVADHDMIILIWTVTEAIDQSKRELLIVHEAMHNERVATIDKGEVQLLLADQSSLSIAPGSDVVINEFVYDPKTQTAKLTATVKTGLLRYVGGASSGKKD